MAAPYLGYLPCMLGWPAFQLITNWHTSLTRVTDRSEAPSVTSFERGEMWWVDDLDVSLFPQQMVGKFRWTLPVTSSSKLIRKDLCEDLWIYWIMSCFFLYVIWAVPKTKLLQRWRFEVFLSAPIWFIFFWTMVCRLRSYGPDGCCSIKGYDGVVLNKTILSQVQISMFPCRL